MNNLTVIEYKDIRVLTTQQLADAYGTETKKITDNFNNNKGRYVEGKHYICLEGEELKQFKSETENLGFAKNLNKLYLWTEKGAFLHAKSLNTDTAWEVYDLLVDNYFEKQNILKDISTELKAIIMHDQKLQKIESRMDRLEYDIPLYGSEADEICNHVKRKGVEKLGGKQSNAYNDSKIRTAVYSDIYNQIKREFGLYDEKGRYKSYKALKRRYIYEAHELIDAYMLPTFLEERVNDCNAQITMGVA